MNYVELIEKTVGDKLIRIVLSKPVKGDEVSKMSVRPVLIRNRQLFQITKVTGTKETNTYREIHDNFTRDELIRELKKAIPYNFLQGLFECDSEGYTVLANKKGTVTVVKNKNITGKRESLEHNRTKQYLIPEGTPVPFLVDLGVMIPDGKVAKAKYDKFRQINRYLEFVDDICDSLDKNREINIIDFGCGKSYLTFALYYYLVVLRKMDVRIIGLDLKPDVIAECNRLKNKYKYNKLEFIQGDIEHFEGVDSVDMVVSLHACDTATDYAIYKAVKWGAKVIMAVPCCQHELNKHIDCSDLLSVTKYGLLKDRISAIFTDAIRANVLEDAGYETQILEFIDMEHTPKNLLIRAVKSGKMRAQKKDDFEQFKDFLGSEITLQKLMQE